MCITCVGVISGVWARLIGGSSYQTPDSIKPANFQITDIRPDAIHIQPQNIDVLRISFVDALHYLRDNGNTILNPCKIDSNDDPNKSGLLCLAARLNNSHNRRCINYILPILKSLGIVGINSSRPNTTWYIP